MLGSIYMASLMKSWWAFVAFYCIGYPVGIGMVYWPPIMCGWEWFPNNKGLVSGLIVAGYGFGAFFFGFISTGIVNPGNVKVDKEHGSFFPKTVSDNVPYMFHMCLVIWAVLVAISVFGVSRNPEYVRTESIRLRKEKIERAKDSSEADLDQT